MLGAAAKRRRARSAELPEDKDGLGGLRVDNAVDARAACTIPDEAKPDNAGLVGVEALGDTDRATTAPMAAAKAAQKRKISGDVVLEQMQFGTGNVMQGASVKLAHYVVDQHAPFHFLARAKELSLEACLNAGQTFSWTRLAPDTWAKFVAHANPPGCADAKPRLWLLRERAGRVEFYAREEEEAALRKELSHYFGLDTDLRALYAEWAARDATFAARTESAGDALHGVRLLAQAPFEALVSFICSQNNAIGRITSLVHTMQSTYGRACTLSHTAADNAPVVVQLHSFPEAGDLAAQHDLSASLRALGYGYRAEYIAETAALVASGRCDLASLQAPAATYVHAWQTLMALPGVGPKVADCVALSGLGHADAVPVDTHIWRLARTHYAGFGGGESLTLPRYVAIGNRLREIFGPRAGWAQLVLFRSQVLRK